ncbi:MAG: peptide-binding protein [Gemmatimonadota bacterium]|nr:MAG: peptide-binding protein [Gemmatimonadota bacterium]
MKRSTFFAPGLGLLIVSLGCGGPSGGEGESSGTSEETGPVRGGTVVIGIPAGPDNLIDATSSTAVGDEVIARMFLPLTSLAADLESYEPELARRWESSEDGRSVTFHLAENARWHDGEPVTSADVLFTHELLTDPLVGYSARSYKDFITDVVADDDFTVTFHFDRRYPYQVLDASAGAILPEHLLKDAPRDQLVATDFARHPVGCGPFKFSRWEPQQFVELVANDDYFEGRPYLDRVLFRIVPEKTSLITQLETGEIDVMPNVPPHEIERLRKSAKHIRIQASEDRNYTYIGWDSTNPLFASARVRRALGMAIDREGLIQSLCYGFADPIDGPIHPRLWAHNPAIQPLPYDPAAARALLAEEGWVDSDGDGWLDKNGEVFEFILKTNLGNQVRMDATILIQSMLQKVGVKVEPRTYEWNVLWSSVIDHSYESAVLVGWSIALKIDLKATFHTEAISGKFNHTEYSNPRVDELIDGALAAETFEEARPLWYEVQERIVADQPYTFLYTIQSLLGVNERVRGTAPDFRGTYDNLHEWWIPSARQRRR